MTTVQQTHGLCSCAEWTGVPLSLLLNEAGIKTAGTWLVTEGVENVMGGSTIPMAKALDDCVVAYGMNGEMVRPQHGYPLRLMVPGFEGIFHTKWLRRIKVVDRYYLTYNDFGHLSQDPIEAALGYQIGPKSVITHPSGGQQLPDRNFYEIRGLAWSGHGAISRVEVSVDAGRTWADAQFQGTPQKMAHTRFTFPWRWDGSETEIWSRATDEIGQVQPTRAQAAMFGREGSVYPNAPGQQPRVRGMDNSIQPWRIARDGSVSNAIA
jgi:sulfane dehydrogenase subunit SoxC